VYNLCDTKKEFGNERIFSEADEDEEEPLASSPAEVSSGQAR